MAEGATTLFVGGLPTDCPMEEIQGYFCQYGECKVDVKLDPTSGRSRGFGYIEFSDPASGDACLANAANHTIRDKWVDVKTYTKGGKGGMKGGKGGKKGGKGAPAAGGYGGGGYGGGGAPGYASGSPTLFIGGIPQEVTQQEFQDYFAQYGQIKTVELKTDPTSGRSRGFGFVEYADASAAASAIANREHHTLHDKWIDVKAYEKGSSKGAGKGKGGKGKGGKGKGPPAYAAAPAAGYGGYRAPAAQSYAPTYGAAAAPSYRQQSYAPTYGGGAASYGGAAGYGAPAGGYGARYAPY